MKKMCKVKNRGASVVVYRVPELGIRRSFAPGETKEIDYEELEKLTYRPGGMAILTKFLQIQDSETINSFGMRVEPEYYMMLWILRQLVLLILLKSIVFLCL